MLTRLRSFLAVLLMIGLSFQAAWSMEPVCEYGGSMTHQAVGAVEISAPTENVDAASADAASEPTQQCDRMLLTCQAAVLPGSLPQLALFAPGQSFHSSSVSAILFLTDGPQRPPRSA